MGGDASQEIAVRTIPHGLGADQIAFDMMML
jgi:hypothetical protein